MKALAHTPMPVTHNWELANLGRRVPRSLRQARDLSTARRIVATAEDIFAERGLAGARMDEIARAAKVNKALLYYYFRSKEELYRFVLETLLSQLSTDVGRAGADDVEVPRPPTTEQSLAPPHEVQRTWLGRILGRV